MTPAKDAGFTLVELLVALAVAGLVGLIAMHGIGFTTSGVARLSAAVERLDQRRGLEMQLRRVFGSLAAVSDVDGRPVFAGTSTDVSFVGIIEDGGAGLYRLRLAFDANRSDRPLVLTRQLTDSGGPPRTVEGVLARQVKGFALAYFGAPNPADKPSWQQRWQDLAQPPLMVRAIFDDGDGVEHPPIVIRLPNGS